MKEQYYQCLGCFQVYVGKPNTCCEKHPGEPYILERISRDQFIEHRRLIDEYPESQPLPLPSMDYMSVDFDGVEYWIRA